MAVALLRTENLRSCKKIQVEPHPQLNLIVGDNATGKTTLLEALFVAARGRSFRTQNLGELCGTAGPFWNAFLEIRGEFSCHHRVGIGWSRDGLEMRLDEERNAKVSDVVRAIPIQLIDPLSHRLLDEGPAYRRSFVDWGVFHVEQGFLDIWRRYQRALRQRNKALRENLGLKAVLAWNEELASSGEALSEMRHRHVIAANRALPGWGRRLLGTENVAAEWNRGWPADESYRDSLERNLDQHMKLGTTVQGPHRAELRISYLKARAKGRVSRGQQKMMVAAMVLAQTELLVSNGVTPPILLLDDFASELAPEFQIRLAEALVAYSGQKFVTAFEVPTSFYQNNATVFHVEHGIVRKLDRFH